jgi:hypothetical protein
VRTPPGVDDPTGYGRLVPAPEVIFVPRRAASFANLLISSLRFIGCLVRYPTDWALNKVVGG